MAYSVDKEMLKAQYESMIMEELPNMKRTDKTYPHQKILGAIYSFALSAFLTWCSSVDGSYFPLLFKGNEMFRYLVCFSPMIVTGIFEISVGLSAIIIKKDIDLKFEMNSFAWKKKFYRYILEKLNYLNYEKQSTLQDTFVYIRNMLTEQESVEIFEDDFENFLKHQYEKYEMNVSCDFFKRLARVILLERDLDGSLIDKGKGRYEVYIVAESEFYIQLPLVVELK